MVPIATRKRFTGGEDVQPTRRVGAELSDEFVKPLEATARIEDSNERPVGLVEIAGRVKWFDAAKGYGFILPDSGEADVLIHVTVLRRDGFTTLREGARVVAEAQRRERGLQVFKVLAITEPDPASAPDLPPPRTRAQASTVGAFEIVIVKWFNRSRASASSPAARAPKTFSSIWRLCAAMASSIRSRATACWRGLVRGRRG